ncbi:MAG: HAMP domain-containing histidine kinase [Thermoguttaceae bacterium]|nr:HAMP domain-containing histidine kinase [Thermoguttaceae bacterium]
MHLEDQDHRPAESAAAIDGGGAGRIETPPDSALLDALAEFAAGRGHEINNPLAIISGHAQILLQEAEAADERHHLAVILAQVKRAYEMIADVRLFSRPPEPQISVFSPRQWLASSLDVWEEDHASPAVSLVRHRFEGEDSFASDPAMLGTILGALLKNAREALVSQRGVIQVSGQCRGGYFLFSVEDDGPGIAEEVRPHIFSPYFSGRPAGRGLGFGLPKAYALTRALGGTITLEDTPGCRVVVRVPHAPRKDKTV